MVYNVYQSFSCTLNVEIEVDVSLTVIGVLAKFQVALRDLGK